MPIENEKVVNKHESTAEWFFGVLDKTERWHKLTNKEKEAFKKIIRLHHETLTEDKATALPLMVLMYSSFLCGCGFDGNNDTWRA